MQRDLDTANLHLLLDAAEVVITPAGHSESEHDGADPSDRVTDEGTTIGRADPTQAAMADTLERMSTTITAHLSAMDAKMEALAHRVDAIDGSQGSQRRAESPGAIPWADRDPTERASYGYDDAFVVWPEDEDSDLFGDTGEEPEASALRPVSEKTAASLKECFSRTMPNATRKKWRLTYGTPQSEATRCPMFDTTVKTQVSKQVKDGDRPLARLQTLVLDAVGPLAAILEEAAKGNLSPRVAVEAATTSLRLLGNASANLSQERRRRIVVDLNKDLKDLIEDPDHFKEAAPMLFGKAFDQVAKNHVDAIKALRRVTQPGNRQSQFFRPGRPHNPQYGRGGGQYRGNYRGNGRGRYHPYLQRQGQGNRENFRQKNGGNFAKT